MENKFPVLFRVLGVLNIIGGMKLTFIAAIILMSNDSYYHFLAPFYSLTALWYISSSFCWFLGGKRAATYLLLTGVTSVILAIGVLIFYFVINPENPTAKIIFGTGAIFLILYSVFTFLAFKQKSISNWKTAQGIPPSKKPGLLTLLYSFSIIGSGVLFILLSPRTSPYAYYDSNNETTEEYTEEYYEPDYDMESDEIEVYDRTIPHMTLISLYNNLSAKGEERYMYDCPYMKTGEVIELNGIQYGQFIGGPNSLRHEIFPVICAKNKLEFEDVWEMFSLKAEIRIFNSLESPTVFEGEDEIQNSNDKWARGYSYKENFIRWAYSNFIPVPDATIAGKKVTAIYDVVFKRFFRLMVESYVELNNNYVISKEVKWYNEAVNSDEYFLGQLSKRYSGVLKEYIASEEVMMSPFQPYMAMGFWIRRYMDNTMNATFDGLRYLMNQYDKDWIDSKVSFG